MRKKFLKKMATSMRYAWVALAMTTLAACDKDEDNNFKEIEFDFAPVVVSIEPVDASGNNLMEAIKDWTITAEWRGVVYTKDSTKTQKPPTRAYMPHFKGIYTSYDSTRLCFGELFGELAYKNEQVLLHWEDGSCDTIVFSRELIEKGYYDFDVIEEISLNGVPQESFELQIVKKL